MDKEEWLNRCAYALKHIGGLDDTSAKAAAEACFEFVGGDLTESPEDVADEEMSNWSD